MAAPRVTRLGEETWLVEFEARIDPAVNRRVLSLARSIEGTALRGVRDVVPAFASLAVHADVRQLDVADFERTLHELVARQGNEEPEGQSHDIPVCYGGEYGPDLGDVAAVSGLDVQEVIRRHTAPAYRVYMLGFLPGFPYLGVVDSTIAVARRATPRPLVKAGSIGIAGQQTGIYPSDSPGGWQIIGRTPVRIFDSSREPRPRLRPGDRVRFHPCDATVFEGAWSGAQPS
jgi:inhibitor of KinA